MWKILKNIKNIGLSVNVAIPTFGICDYFSGSCTIAITLLIHLYIVLLSKHLQSHVLFLEPEWLNRKTGLLGRGNLENKMSCAASELARVPRTNLRLASTQSSITDQVPSESLENKAEVIPHDPWRLRVTSTKPALSLSGRVASEGWPPSLTHSIDFAMASLISRLAHGAIPSVDAFLL